MQDNTLLPSTSSSTNIPASEPVIHEPVETLAPTLVHVVRYDAIDASEVLTSCQQLGADTVFVDNPTEWLESLAGRADPPDLIVLVGRAEGLLASGVVRAAAEASDAERVLVAAAGAEVEHAAGFMNQGARGLMLLPAASMGLIDAIKPHVAAASDSRGARRQRDSLRRHMQAITRGEAEVLQELLQGAANKQIAQKLGIGLRTVELRRSKVMRKMNASSIAQLVLHIAEAGVERVPPLLLGRKRAPRS